METKNSRISSEFNNYNEVPTDVEIHCENMMYRVHKDILSKISPVFKAYFVEKRCNRLEIADFEFRTVRTALDIVYDRPTCFPSAMSMLSILSFAGKYCITDIFHKVEKLLFQYLSINNFGAVLRCVEDIANQEFLTKCASFFKLNEDAIKTTKGFAEIPGSLVIKLSNEFETELDAFFHLHQIGYDIDINHMPITTFPDFLKAISYATKHDNHEVYNAALSIFLPVFEARFTENCKNMLEIPGFTFQTVETALNACYGQPCGKISVALASDVLLFFKKHEITKVSDSFEELINCNLSTINFFDILQCAYDCTSKDLFETCAAFYKTNEDVLKNTDAFLALPGPLHRKKKGTRLR